MNFNKIGRYLFYAFIFLLPLSYIPNANIPFEVNKTMFLLCFLTPIAILGLVDIIKQGKYDLRNKIILGGVSLFVIYAIISTFFLSTNITNSFFGGIDGCNSLISLLIYSGIFLITPIFIKKKEEIKNLIVAFISGIFVLNIAFLGSYFMEGNASLPLSSLNVLPLLNVLGITSIFFLFKKEENPSVRGLLGLSATIFLITNILINFNISWFLLGVIFFLIFWDKLLFKDFKKGSFALLFITVFSLSLFVFNIAFPFEKKIDDQKLSLDDSFQISKNATFFGQGIGTYNETFLKYNPSKIEGNSFSESFSVVFTILNDLGFLGLILFLLPFSIALFKGFKFFLRGKQDYLEKVVFLSLLGLVILLFFFGFDFTLMSLLFLFLALFMLFSNKEEFVFKTKNPKMIFLNLACLSLLVLSIIVVNYFNFLNYSAEKYYGLALEAFTEDKEKGIEYLEKSNAFIEKEKTLIGLSQLYLLKASNLYTESKLLETKEEDRAEIELNCEKYMDLSEEKAIRATEINKNNYYAFNNLGLIYENRRYLRDEELSSQIIEAYDKASLLSPYTKEAYEALIQIYSELGNVEMRENYLEKIRVIEPDYLK